MKKRLLSIMIILILLTALFATVVHAATISTITVSGIKAPIAGENWTSSSYKPGIANTANYEFDSDCGNYGYEWKDRTTDTFLNVGDTFIAGHEYTLVVYLRVKAGHEFNLVGNNFNLVIESDGIKGISKTNPTEVFSLIDRDKRYGVGIRYNFGKCGYIDEINGIFTSPVGGNKPIYSKGWTTGYGIIKSYTDFDDGNYIKSGVAWYDLTNAEYLTENSKFVCDHSYRLIWYISAGTNYELATSSAITSTVNVTFNGAHATVEKIQGIPLHVAIQAYYDFAAVPHTAGDWEIIKNPKCTKAGLKEKFCTKCGKIVEQQAISATGHKYEKSTTRAILNSDGKIEDKCVNCGDVKSYTTIFHPETFELSQEIFTYNKKVQKPTVTVKDSEGYIIDPSNYDVTYYGGCKKIGEYSVVVTFKGDKYFGAKILKYQIAPKGTKLSKVKAGKKAFTASWKKQTTETTGYQVQYSTTKDFSSGVKNINISKNKTTSTTKKKLKAKAKYYVRIRTYKKVGSQKIYSVWSSAKTVKTKK